MIKVAIDLRFLHIGLGRQYPVQGAIGGIGRVQLEQLRAFEDEKRQFEFLLIGDRRYSKKNLEEAFENLRIKDTLLLSHSLWYRRLPSRSITKPFIKLAQDREYNSFRKQVEKSHPDIVHTHSDPWNIVSAKKNNYKTIVTIHDHLFPVNDAIYRRRLSDLNDDQLKFLDRLRNADCLVAVSDGIREQMIEDYQFSPAQVVTIQNAVDLKSFSSVPQFPNEKQVIKEKFGIDKPYFIYAGSWHPKKRVPFIIEVFEAYRQNYGDCVELIWAGSVEKFAKKQTGLIRRRIQSSQYASDIKELGYLLDDDLALLNRNAEAFLHLSFYEGFGLSICEAMACGVPLITTNGVGALQNTAFHDELIDPLDKETMIRKMHLYRTNSDFRKKHIDKQFSVVEKMTWKNSANALQAVYQQVL
jgi:glycosyltransferase involved in cell wall biosynthesis